MASQEPAGRLLARRSPAREADGMVKPVAKLLSMLTPKRRWAQFLLGSMLLTVFRTKQIPQRPSIDCWNSSRGAASMSVADAMS